MFPNRVTTPTGRSARILILIGLILQAIEVGVLVFLGLFLFLVPFLGTIVLSFALIGIAWLVLVYLFSYQRVKEGDYTGAKTATLVFAILSILTISLISGILYVVAYGELGTAEREQTGPSLPWQPPAPLMTGGKVCPICCRGNALSASFCQGCGFRLG